MDTTRLEPGNPEFNKNAEELIKSGLSLNKSCSICLEILQFFPAMKGDRQMFAGIAKVRYDDSEDEE